MPRKSVRRIPRSASATSFPAYRKGALGPASARSGASSSGADHTQKKTANAAEQDRPDILKRRRIGSMAKSSSIRSVSSSSTRRGRPPIWRACIPGPQGGTAARRHPAGSLEDHDLRRRPSSHRHRRTDAARRSNQPQCLPGLRRAGARARTPPRRHRDHGQFVEP